MAKTVLLESKMRAITMLHRHTAIQNIKKEKKVKVDRNSSLDDVYYTANKSMKPKQLKFVDVNKNAICYNLLC